MPPKEASATHANNAKTATAQPSNGAMSNATQVSPAAMLAKLSLGALVQVSSPDGSLKYLTRLIGVDGSKTLITALPTPKQLKKETVSVVYDNLFFPDKVFVMRLIAQGSVFAFESIVTAVNYTGCKLLLTSFPKNIQSQTLRQDARFPCTFSAQCQLEEIVFDGVLVDISNGGCQLHFDPEQFNIELDKLKNQHLTLTVHFTHEDNSSSLDATIMSVQKIENHDVVLGLAFVQTQKVVSDYINSLQLGEMTSLFL